MHDGPLISRGNGAPFFPESCTDSFDLHETSTFFTGFRLSLEPLGYGPGLRVPLFLAT